MKKASNTLKSAVRQARAHRSAKKARRKFPYEKVAKMWEQGKTIATIAHTIGYIDKDNPKDPYHSLRNFLYRMHKGYKDKNGNIVKLPHRISKSTLRAAKRAGLQAWAPKRKSRAAA